MSDDTSSHVQVSHLYDELLWTQELRLTIGTSWFNSFLRAWMLTRVAHSVTDVH